MPYPDGFETDVIGNLRVQAAGIAEGLTKSGFQTSADREIIAIIAYMQRLGTDIKNADATTTPATVVAQRGR